MNIEKNRYDYMIILLCWVLAAGNIGGFLQPARVLILLMLPFFIADSVQHKIQIGQTLHTPPSYRYELLTFILWGAYSVFSLYWVIDLGSSAKALVHLLINFFGFAELLWLASKAVRPQKALLIGWTLMFLTTIPVALNEFVNDQHLSMSVQESDMTMKVGTHTSEERRFASVTFGNLNSYNVILCMTFCIMLIHTLGEIRKEQLICYGIIVCLIAMIAKNSSRAALLCIAAGFILYALLLFKKRSHAFLLLIGFALIIGLFTFYFADLFSMTMTRFQTQGMEDVGRMGVIVYGLEELVNSYGFGIGIGNFAPTMLTKYHLDIAAPHNLFLEVGVQFGVIILALFVGIFIRIYKRSRTGTTFNRSAAILGILPFIIFISIIDSGYIAKVPTWIYIATIYILSAPEYDDSKMLST